MSTDLETRLSELLTSVAPPPGHVATRARAVATAPPRRSRRVWGRLTWALPALGTAALVAVLAVLLVNTRSADNSPASEVVGTRLVPQFEPADGWRSWTNGLTVDPLAAVTANRDLAVQLDRPPPVELLQSGDILVWVTHPTNIHPTRVEALRVPRPAMANATRTAGPFEGMQFDEVYEFTTDVEATTLHFRVFFGTDAPTEADFGTADAALARFRLVQTDVLAPRVALLDRPQSEAEAAFASRPLFLTTSFVADSIRVSSSDEAATWFAGRTLDGRICVGELTTTRIRSACSTPFELTLNRAVGFEYISEPPTRVWGVLVTDDVTRVRETADAPPFEVTDNMFFASFTRPPFIQVEVAGRFATPDWRSTSALRLSVLEQAPSDRDRLPQAVLDFPMRPGINDPSLARWALSTSGDQHFWVVPGDPGIVCLAATPDHKACAGLVGLDEHGALIVLPQEPQPGGLGWWRYFAAIVPDGYDTARVGDAVVPVSNNVVYIPGVKPGSTGGIRMVLTGPAGTREVALGPE